MELNTFTQSDDYVTHYRLWGEATGGDVIVMLHGGMSHSGWQGPLAEPVVAGSGLSFVATDRRGSGLNAGRGHLPDRDQAVADTVEFLRFLATRFERVHLAGWCFGAQVASAVAAEVAGEGLVTSLLMISPGFVFNERYSDVLSLSVDSALAAVREFGIEPAKDRAYIQVPLQTSDFTTLPDWHKFILEDDLRLTTVTEATVDSWGALAELAEQKFPHVGDIPVLAVFGRQDRLVDNERVEAFLTGHRPVTVEHFDTGHAVQFEEPDKLAGVVTAFVSSTR
ncbi:alpha/beta fold hydrolase [Amycolatopsis sp. H20-H5]|uniref:alpha/beta fold hydrolase n=1 Tax=Amycolatopsis sp. H20-H5 TaxID=3046309 RepID=UPI002DBB6767|nr:alpha/beta hydrolase [Amycolatopsis sp. H20-H5]MEC3980479.1 alpha/beta hydrolase [Amycolatopsis sp. H20-H5]